MYFKNIFISDNKVAISDNKVADKIWTNLFIYLSTTVLIIIYLFIFNEVQCRHAKKPTKPF